MSDAPPAVSYPSAPPPPRSNVPAALLLAIGIVVGAAGATAGGYVATSQLAAPTVAPGDTAAPIATARPVSVLPAPGTDVLVDVVNELLPAVVTIINRLPSGQEQSRGSGFVIDAGRGYLVTNNHVIENVRDTDPGASFDVIFSDNRIAKNVKLVGRDDKTDVAVLQVPSQSLKAATLANSGDVPVGATVVAIGSALGDLQNTVTSGIVSAKGRRLPETDTIVLEDLIQTDAAINETRATPAGRSSGRPRSRSSA